MARAVKRSISFDPQLLADAEMRAKEPPFNGNLSAVVNHALERESKLRGMRELLDDMDREFGPVPPEMYAEAKREIDEWESRSTREP